jgi:hypothetical protein
MCELGYDNKLLPSIPYIDPAIETWHVVGAESPWTEAHVLLWNAEGADVVKGNKYCNTI